MASTAASTSFFSRLARNGRDWHTLLEFCGLVGTLIVDEDGVYDPRHPNDRLLLGMKGTICLLYTSDAADDLLCVDPGGRRIINKN